MLMNVNVVHVGWTYSLMFPALCCKTFTSSDLIKRGALFQDIQGIILHGVVTRGELFNYMGFTDQWFIKNLPAHGYADVKK